MKQCKRCKETLPLSSFYQRKTGIPYTMCRKCYNLDKKERDARRLRENVETVRCTVCEKEKGREQFHRNRSTATGFTAKCKECSYTSNLLVKYKISNMDELIESCGNRCQICKNEFVLRPHVDHDHTCCPSDYTCGQCFRGLLCGDCNLGLGLFRDKIENLEGAAEYLRKFI